jgi:hypothetical protein
MLQALRNLFDDQPSPPSVLPGHERRLGIREQSSIRQPLR